MPHCLLRTFVSSTPFLPLSQVVDNSYEHAQESALVKKSSLDPMSLCSHHPTFLCSFPKSCTFYLLSPCLHHTILSSFYSGGSSVSTIPWRLTCQSHHWPPSSGHFSVLILPCWQSWIQVITPSLLKSFLTLVCVTTCSPGFPLPWLPFSVTFAGSSSQTSQCRHVPGSVVGLPSFQESNLVLWLHLPSISLLAVHS